MPPKKKAGSSHSDLRKKSGAAQLHEKMTEEEGHKLAAMVSKAGEKTRNAKDYVTMPSNGPHKKKKAPKATAQPEVVPKEEQDRLGEELVRRAHERISARREAPH